MKLSQNTANYLESTSHKPTILNEAQRAKLKEKAKWGTIWSLAVLSTFSAFSLGIICLTISIQDFFKSNELVFATPIEVRVKTNKVVTIKPVKHEIIVLGNTESNKTVVAASQDQTVAEKICAKFSDRCEVAVAVATAESNLRIDAIGINQNSVDVGVFQINYPTHKGKEECTLDKISTVDGNIECAYRIYKDNGNSFAPWTAYATGAYLARVK